MTRLFLRLYLAVSIAVLLSSATTGFVFWSSWQPESNAQLTRLVTPVMLEIGKELRQALPPQPDPYPEEWISALSIPGLKPPQGARYQRLKGFAEETTWLLAILPVQLLELSPDERGRLMSGSVVYRNRSKGRLAYVALNNGEVLEATLFSSNTPLKQVLSGFHFLTHRTGHHQAPFKGIEGQLLGHEKIISTPLKDSSLSDLEVVRLLYGPRSYARLIGTSHLVQAIAFTEAGDPLLTELELELSLPVFPPTLLIPLAVLLIGIALWLTLSPLRRKLSMLASVTERFGAGDLSARVALEGLGPLESISQRFDRSADRIERLIQSHESLLQAVSHELRTPISRLYFYNDLLIDEEDRAQRERLGQDVHVTLEELRSLTTELLDFTRLSAGETLLIQEPCDLSQLTHSALDQVKPHQKLLELTPSVEGADLEFELQTLGEDRLLIRAILNLLKNADKYAERLVRVTLGRGQAPEALCFEGLEREGWVWVRVDDDGPGIPEEERERIFEPFVRLEQSRSRAQGGGAGLGLSIVLSIIKAHRGLLMVEESPLGGARFTIYLKAS